MKRIFFQKGQKRFKPLSTRKWVSKCLSLLPIFQILQSVLSRIKLCHSLSLYFNVHYKNYIGYTYVMSMSCRVKPVYPLLLFTLYPFSYVLCIISQLFFNLTSKVLFISILHLFQFKRLHLSLQLSMVFNFSLGRISVVHNNIGSE